MAKISLLPPAGPLDGSETIPLVQDDETRGANIAAYTNDLMQPYVQEAQTARDQAIEAIDAALDPQKLQEALFRVRHYDSALTFISFVDTTTATPASVKHNAYISTATGNVFGLAAAVGDLIVADGTGFDIVKDRAKVVYPLADPSYNKFDKRVAVPDHLLNTTTGKPTKSISTSRWMTDFMFVEGVTFIASNAFGSGSMIAYDENKDFISVVAFNADGINGKYALPAGTSYVRAAGQNPDTVYMYLDDLSRLGTYHAYGVTEDSLALAETDAEVAMKARIDYVKTLNIVDGVNVLDPNDFTPGFTLNSSGAVIVSETKSVTKFLYCKGRSFASTNMFLYGGVYAYDEDYNFISAIARNTVTGFFDIPGTAYYIRSVFNTAAIGTEYLYWDTALTTRYPFLQDRYAYKYKGKKLGTIGDSITFQKSWQPRLAGLLGMEWSEAETREGVGYVEIDPGTFEDIGNYVAVDAAIVTTGTTFVDGYGANITIFAKGALRYRRAFRMAAGGETVMPRAGTTQSIYSRCGDSQYYGYDMIIIGGGANDRGYCNWLPTVLPNGRLSDITGITNLESDDPDLVSNYEIHTAEANYTDIGDFTAEGDTQGTRKQSGTFRAAYRGMLKKVIDGNPGVPIVLLQHPRTFLYGDVYQNKVSQYVANELNRVIGDVGKEFGCQTVDLSKIFGTYNADEYFTADGAFVHPNAAGGLKMADFIDSQIG